jgi:hypothetical protein
MIKKMSKIKGGINFNLDEEILSSVANALLGVKFINILLEAFTRADPKSTKRY